MVLLALIPYLLIGVALAELFKQECILYSYVEYVAVVLLYPIIIVSVFCLILRDWWKDRK